MKIGIICEDERLDQYVLRPVMERLFQNLEKRATVDVLPLGSIQGFEHVVKNKDTIPQIIAANPMYKIFLLVVDRDGDRKGNTQKVKDREQENQDRLIGCLAIEELEVWVVALHHDPQTDDPWPTIRNHPDPKEAYWEPLARQRGWTGPGGGRHHAMQHQDCAWDKLFHRCHELSQLEQALNNWFERQKALENPAPPRRERPRRR